MYASQLKLLSHLFFFHRAWLKTAVMLRLMKACTPDNCMSLTPENIFRARWLKNICQCEELIFFFFSFFLKLRFGSWCHEAHAELKRPYLWCKGTRSGNSKECYLGRSEKCYSTGPRSCRMEGPLLSGGMHGWMDGSQDGGMAAAYFFILKKKVEF